MPPGVDLVRLKNEYSRREHNPGATDLYSLFNLASLYSVQQRQREVLQILLSQGFYPLDTKRILDLGCGRGNVLLEFLGLGALPSRLSGFDLLHYRLVDAKAKLPTVSLACGDGQDLPYRSHMFDLIVQYTVFTSILDSQVKHNIAREMVRVLNPNGLILWYDFWLNPINPQTQGIRPKEIRQLFPDCKIQLRRVTLAPPLARRLVGISWTLCSLLEKLKVFNSHYLATIRPV